MAARDGAIFVDVSALKAATPATAETRSLDSLPGPKGLPLVGNLHQMDPTKVHRTFEAWAEQYGPVYKLQMGPQRAVAVSDPHMINELLRARPDNFRRSSNMDRIISEIGIKGVFNAEGDAWRPQRKLSVAALAQRNLRQLYPSINIVARRLKSRWERSAGEALDLVEDLKRFTVDVTMLIAFGYDVDTVEQADDVIQRELEIIFPAINRRLFALFPVWRIVRSSSDRQLERALKNCSRLAPAASWTMRVSASKRTPTARIDRPISSRRCWPPSTKRVNRLPTTSSCRIFLTMLLAGEDTTANTLAWAVHHLCDSPEWAAEVRREADEAIGANRRRRRHRRRERTDASRRGRG